MKRMVLIFILVPLRFAACGGKTWIEIPSEDEKVFRGDIMGRIVLPGMDTGVYLTEVTLSGDTLDEPAVLYTDEEGRFHFSDLPAGIYDIDALKGRFTAGSVAHLTEDAEVLDMGDIPLGSGDTAFAVIQGDYDRFEDLLAEMGVEGVDLYDGTTGEGAAFLADMDQLGSYDILAINDGIVEDLILEDEEVLSNISSFVEGGGGLYLSNRNYEMADALFDSYLLFLNEGGDGSAEKGQSGDYMAEILNEELLAILSPLENVIIQYDLDGWAVPLGATDDVEPLLLGKDLVYTGESGEAATIESAPITAMIPYGEGRVIFNTFDFMGSVNSDMKLIGNYLVLSL